MLNATISTRSPKLNNNEFDQNLKIYRFGSAGTQKNLETVILSKTEYILRWGSSIEV